jgi:signal transduction histidine kinase
VLSFGSVSDGYAWPDDLVERLRLLSEAFAGVLERRRMELSLAERLRFEKLLSFLATAFSHLSAADFDSAVQRGLREVVDFLGVDRGSLIEFIRDGTATRSWAVEEWVEMGEFPWMTARLQRGEVINVSRPQRDRRRHRVADSKRHDHAQRLDEPRARLDSNLPKARGDRVQLQQVVLNLVLNGLEAVPEPQKGARTLVIRTARDGAAGLWVTVQDSGPGMDEKHLAHIFEPLCTTKTGHGPGHRADHRERARRRGRGREQSGRRRFTLPVSREGERVDDDPSVRKSLTGLAGLGELPGRGVRIRPGVPRARARTRGRAA